MRDAIHTERAPAAIGPYSQAVRAGNMVFTSGMGGVDPATRTLVAGGVAAETERALHNLAATLEAAGSSLDHVVRVGLFLADMADFAAVNEVYRGFFAEPFPARTTVAVRELPAGLHVEIDCIAVVAES
ncbi:MAG: RidA family protein [Candidatus Limnocylindria bacterium]